SEVSGLAKGDNVLRWVVEKENCRSEDEVRLTNDLPSEPYAGRDLEVCEPQHELRAATPEYGDGVWSIVEGGGNLSDVNDPRAEISNLQPGTNRLKWTLTKGQCIRSDEIVVENFTPTTADAGPDVEDCKNYAELDANTPIHGQGEWSIVSGHGSFVNPADESTTVEDLTFGENILMWEINNGDHCYSRDTVKIFNKIPDQADAGKDRVICENYLTLNSNEAKDGEGTWSVVSGSGDFDDPHSNNTVVRDIGFGENVYKWTIAYGDCTTESTMTVTSKKTDAYAGEDVVVYDPEVFLNANNAGDLNASWEVVGGQGEFEDETFFNTKVTGLKEGTNTYRWTINVDDCISYDDVQVEYRPSPDAGFVTDTAEGCWPLTVDFTNYSVGAQERDYQWDFGDGNTSDEQNPTHTFNEPGEYPVQLTVPGPDSIEGHYQKIINVYGHPTAAFGVEPDLVYVPGDEVRLFDLSEGAVEYEWHFGDDSISHEEHPRHEYQEAGSYDIKLIVTNEYGCKDSILTEDAVTARSSGFIKFPNAFKPRPDYDSNSGDRSETNSVFKPVYRDVENYRLQIYNRWGQLIYESNDIDEGWNGHYNGQLAPQAVYVWKVKGTFINGKEFRKTGSVLLVR
ncbi:MAG: PKD domain-containing protein, partial [Bacteroidota bacterium]